MAALMWQLKAWEGNVGNDVHGKEHLGVGLGPDKYIWVFILWFQVLVSWE